MFRRSLGVSALILLAASSAPACSMSPLDPDALIENTPVCSANGRFCVVVRRYPVPDFTTERAGKVLGLDNPEPIDDGQDPAPKPEPPKTVIAALYDVTGRSRVLLRELAMEWEHARDVRVSSSGRYVVGFSGLRRGGCGGWANEDDPLLAIYDSRGSRVTVLKVGDLLSSYDILKLNDDSAFIQLELKPESESREVAVLQIPAPPDGERPRVEERRVDLVTGALLDAKRDIYPLPRAYAEPGETSRELFARAVRAPLPEFPIVGLRARIRGIVRIEILVSEKGEVLDTRVTKPLPFGFDDAAVVAVRRWLFKPAMLDGRAVKARGEIVFQFKDVDAATWARLARTLPPSE
jgi:TonB family protein